MKKHATLFIKRKIIAFLLAVVIIFSLGAANVYADNSSLIRYYGVNIKNSGEPGPLFNTRVEDYCQGGPHYMFAHGWGSIVDITHNNTTVVSFGCCAQCSKCNLVIVTQGEPGTGNPLGYYTTWQPNESLTSFVTVIYQTSNNILYTSSSTIPGISFRFS